MSGASGNLHRILLVDPGDFTSPYDLALAGAIQAEGKEVRLLGQAGDGQRHPLHDGHFYPVLASSWGRLLPAGSARLIKGACHGIDMLRLARWVDAFGAQVIHFQWSPIPTVDHWAIRVLRRGAPVVLTLHDSNPYQGAASWLMRRGYAGLLKAADAIIVHTQQAERRVAEHGIDPTLIHRIPHGLLEGGACAPTLRPDRARRNRLVLLQFGKIKPYKGVDLLLEALALLPRWVRNRLDVRIIGKSFLDTGGLERFAHAKELDDCVTFRFEFVSETEAERQFAEADAILLPYREIDASGVAMSAMARGLPVLATAIDGFRELFEGKGGARLVPAAEAPALAGAIAEWVTDPAQLDAAHEAMRRTRASIPTWSEIARLHFAVYGSARGRWITDRVRSVAAERL
jgi:glycosyltransferase involved in cell wall biosynthesis